MVLSVRFPFGYNNLALKYLTRVSCSNAPLGGGAFCPILGIACIPYWPESTMNSAELIERYLLKLLDLWLSNWMTAPAAGKTVPARATLVHPQIVRIGVTKDEPIAPAV